MSNEPVLWVFEKEGAPGQFLTPVEEGTNRRFLLVYSNPMVAVEFAARYPEAGNRLAGLNGDGITQVVDQSLTDLTLHVAVDWNGAGNPPLMHIRDLLNFVGRPLDTDPVAFFGGFQGPRMPTFGPPDGSIKVVMVALPDGDRPAIAPNGRPLNWVPIRRSQVESFVEGAMRAGAGHYGLPGPWNPVLISKLMELSTS